MYFQNPNESPVCLNPSSKNTLSSNHKIFFLNYTYIYIVPKEENFDLVMNWDNIWRNTIWNTTQKILTFRYGVAEIGLRAKPILILITMLHLQWGLQRPPQLPPIVVQPRRVRRDLVLPSNLSLNILHILAHTQWSIAWNLILVKFYRYISFYWKHILLIITIVNPFKKRS